jgi:hypothetical protein
MGTSLSPSLGRKQLRSAQNPSQVLTLPPSPQILGDLGILDLVLPALAKNWGYFWEFSQGRSAKYFTLGYSLLKSGLRVLCIHLSRNRQIDGDPPKSLRG